VDGAIDAVTDGALTPDVERPMAVVLVGVDGDVDVDDDEETEEAVDEADVERLFGNCV
jgi:hypothetical protein